MASEFTIRDSIARRYWAMAALEELAEQYRERGFSVEMNTPVEGFEADLVARQGERLEVVEVKSGRWSEAQRAAVAQLRALVAHRPHAAFKLLWVNPPKVPQLTIADFESILAGLWTERVDQSSVAEVASQVLFETVDEYTLDAVRIEKNEIEVAGSGTASFELQYGGTRDGVTLPASFPFSFRVSLNGSLKVSDVLEWDADTSSFYE